MTQEEKDFLLKDLCARLPYALKASVRGSDEENVAFDILSVSTNFKVLVESRFMSVSNHDDIEVIRPYLRPISSMTEEESKEFALLQTDFYIDGFLYPIAAIGMINWLNAHHFDYRGLIEKGLALEAPEEMYQVN